MEPCGCKGPTCCKETQYRDPGSDPQDPEHHGKQLETLEDCRSLNGGNYDCACYYVINTKSPPAPAPVPPKPHGRKMSQAERARILKVPGQSISIECIRTKKKAPDTPWEAGLRPQAKETGERLA